MSFHHRSGFGIQVIVWYDHARPSSKIIATIYPLDLIFVFEFTFPFFYSLSIVLQQFQHSGLGALSSCRFISRKQVLYPEESARKKEGIPTSSYADSIITYIKLILTPNGIPNRFDIYSLMDWNGLRIKCSNLKRWNIKTLPKKVAQPSDRCSADWIKRYILYHHIKVGTKLVTES